MGGSSCRPVTNTASSLPDRISGCSSDKEALGIILLMSDAHLVPFPDIYPPPQDPSPHVTCPNAAASTCLVSSCLEKLLLECYFKLTLAVMASMGRSSSSVETCGKWPPGQSSSDICIILFQGQSLQGSSQGSDSGLGIFLWTTAVEGLGAASLRVKFLGWQIPTHVTHCLE